MKFVSLLLLLCTTSFADTYPFDWSPGAIDKTCTMEEICGKHHSTKGRRPPDSYTNKLKKQQQEEHHVDCKNGCEEDHVIPIELCGDPRDPQNLSPESYDGPYGAHQKDWVEDDLHKRVCEGTLSLATAQFIVSHLWVPYYKQNHLFTED